MLCQFESKVFESEKGNCIYIFGTREEIPKKGCIKKKKGISYFKGIGNYLPADKTLPLELSGMWVESDYGLQFEVSGCNKEIPVTKDGIYHYLINSGIKGIGSKTAEKIVETFGTDTLKILEKEPKKLLEVKGIPKSIYDQVIQTYGNTKELQNIMMELAPFGISKAKVKKIYEKYGEGAAEMIHNDPYVLCDISGFGFITVEEMAQKLKCNLNSPKRMQAAVKYILEREAKQKGHLYLPAMELVEEVLILLNGKKETVNQNEVQQSIKEQAAQSIIIAEKGNVYLPQYFYAEADTARNIVQMLNQPQDTIPNLEIEIRNAEKELNIFLSDSQKKAVKMCLENTISIITGGPGTGKTTIIQVILRIYEKVRQRKEVALLAPTGRASRRMAETTGILQACTIHSALGIVSEDYQRQHEGNELEADFIIIDESSMIGMRLMAKFLSALKHKCKLLFLGDIDQLPSVSAGNVFRELIQCGYIPVTRLDTIFRQSEGSNIALNALKMNKGETQLHYGSDFVWIERQKEQEAISDLMDTYVEAIKKFGIENVQMLLPYKKKRKTSTSEMNPQIRDIVNPSQKGKPELVITKRTFRLGDRVMQTKNKDGISNGDIGFITGINMTRKTIIITFSDNRVVQYDTETMSMIELAYAITIHKSQGSEYQMVIVPVFKSYWNMLKRNLYYTAITRGKTKAVLIGQKEALKTAILNNDITQRNTMLAVKIKSFYEGSIRTKKKFESKQSEDNSKQIKLSAV